jgi:hypothetical protein
MRDESKGESPDDFYRERFNGREELESLFFAGTPFERTAPLARKAPTLRCVMNNDKTGAGGTRELAYSIEGKGGALRRPFALTTELSMLN